jgi:hypothetical protein
VAGRFAARISEGSSDHALRIWMHALPWNVTSHRSLSGGEGGIRTRVTFARIPDFDSDAFD